MHDDIIVGATWLGTNRPIPLMRLKGWLFQQSRILGNPSTQLHPMRWTSISKGQVWNPPPKVPGRGQAAGGTDWTFNSS